MLNKQKSAIESNGGRFYGVCSGVTSTGIREVMHVDSGEVFRCGQFLRVNGSYLCERVADGVVMVLGGGMRRKGGGV